MQATLAKVTVFSALIVPALLLFRRLRRKGEVDDKELPLTKTEEEKGYEMM